MVELKVGTAYKARNGERELIVGNDGNPNYPFNGEGVRSYMPNGREYEARETEHDLIAEWQDAPKTGEWIGWNGGECPVHPETVVEIKIADTDEFQWNMEHIKAKLCVWRHEGDCADLIAYRIITPYAEPQKPREFWLAPFPDGFQVVDKASWYGDVIHVREVMPDE